MKIKNVKVAFLEESIIRSGYPMQTGEPEDLYDETPWSETEGECKIDLYASLENVKHAERAIKLANALSGSGHDNFLKGIIVQFDLQYPEYFSPQLQRYNWINIVSSQSKMHRITSRELNREDFNNQVSVQIINRLKEWIKSYNSWDFSKSCLYLEDFMGETYFNNSIKSKEELFQHIISNLPSGYLKWMAISTNYLQLKTIYNQRKNHKLVEWREFCEFIKTLPMSELITGKDGTEI
jgi:hypothetical protein